MREYKVIAKHHILLDLVFLLAVGVLCMFVPVLNNYWAGLMAAGVLYGIFYKWRLVEK